MCLCRLQLWPEADRQNEELARQDGSRDAVPWSIPSCSKWFNSYILFNLSWIMLNLNVFWHVLTHITFWLCWLPAICPTTSHDHRNHTFHRCGTDSALKRWHHHRLFLAVIKALVSTSALLSVTLNVYITIYIYIYTYIYIYMYSEYIHLHIITYKMTWNCTSVDHSMS